MRTTRHAAGIAGAVATIALLVPAVAGATIAVTGTLDLKGGVCLTANTCLLVGDDGAGHGALVPMSEVDTQSKAAACSSDAKTVGIAVAAYWAINPGKAPTTSAGWKAALLGHKHDGPYLQSWPSSRYYVIAVAGKAPGRTTGDHVATSNGDVIVTAVDNANRTYDATVDSNSACQYLHVFVPVAGTEVSDGSTDGIAGIACPAGKTTCYGVTQNVSPNEGGVVVINVSTPAHPTVTATDPVSLTASLSAIACPTSTACVAVGTGPLNQGEVVPIVDGVVGSPASHPNESYRGIACVSPTLCFAAGTNVAANEGVIVPIHLSTTATLGAPVDVPSTRALQAVTCPTPSACYAVGARINSSKVSSGVVVPFGVTAATAKPGTVRSVAGTSQLTAVECLGAGECEVTGLQTGSGDYGVAAGVTRGRAGAAYEVPGTTSIDGIACIDRTVCLGLGSGPSSNGVIQQLSATIVTKTSLRVSANPVRTHRRVAYTAIVAPAPASGSVAFTSDGNTIAGCRVVAVRSGVARCVVTNGRPDGRVVRATYSGEALERGSISKPVVERVAS